MNTLSHNSKMGGIIEDALTVQNYLPWIESDEEIINVMRKIPLNKSYLRIPITLKFFLNQKDSNNCVLEQEMENDAKDIVTVLPTCPFHEIKKHLKTLGNISNRKEVALRLLLNDRDDLDIKLEELSSSDLLNRKRDQQKRSFITQKDDLIENNIKVRKLDMDHNRFSGLSYIMKTLKATQPQNIVAQPSSSLKNNAQTNISQVAHSLPAMAAQVPDMFQLVQAMPEPRVDSPVSQTITSQKLPEPTVLTPSPTGSTSDMEENSLAIAENFVKEMSERDYVQSDIGISLPVDLSQPGPSQENYRDSVLIDLVEDDVPSDTHLQKKRNCNEKLVLKLIEMFPETCSEYIRDICDNKSENDFDDLVSTILDDENHPKRQRPPASPVRVDPEEQFETVKALLPDADPTYLRMKCDVLAFNPEELNKFIVEASEKKDYPTMKDYLRNQQLSAQSKQYTTEFCVEKFVEIFPEPHITFSDSNRDLDVDNYSQLYIKQYLQNKFDKLPLKVINIVLKQHKFNIIKAYNNLMCLQNSSLKMKSRRKPTVLYSNISNIPVLQQLAYLEHKDEIDTFLKTKADRDEEDRLYAKNNGLMKTCQCCFDDEVMPKDTFYCPKECLFCRSCIKKSCEISFGEGKINFMCLNDCGEEFNLQTLKTILTPKMFSKIAQKKMIEEIKAAGIEELEMCPFCDFASIPNEQDKIFRCLNPDCMKESCRNCKEPNHIPLHCDEIEKDENVKARVFLENKMTEALLCKCWKCGLSFFKEEGCNKMTCTCGAKMCYVCKKPVKDYKHFNGMGGDNYHLCPLYSNNDHLNKQKVLNAAQEAKAQIDQSKLKVDPTENLLEHYDNRTTSTLPNHHNLLMNFAMGRHRYIVNDRRRHRRHLH